MKKLLYLTPLLVFLFAIPFAHADTLAAGCSAGDTYSPTTGELCVIPQTCQPGDLYNSQTGAPCSGNTYLPGCFAGSLYSVTTGESCSVPAVSNTTRTTITNTQPEVTALVTSTPQPAPVSVENVTNDTISESALSSCSEGCLHPPVGTFGVENISQSPIVLTGATLAISSGQPGNNFPIWFSLTNGNTYDMGDVNEVVDNTGGSQTISFPTPVTVEPGIGNAEIFVIKMDALALPPALVGQSITAVVTINGTVTNGSPLTIPPITIVGTVTQ